MRTKSKSTPSLSRSIGALALFLAALVLIPRVAARDDVVDPEVNTGQEVRLWLEILDAKGRIETLSSAESITVIDGGQESTDVRLGSPAAAIETTILIDQALSTSGTLRRGSAALARRIDRLVELGEVEIQQLGAEGLSSQFAGRDALVLREMLTRSGLTARGEEGVLEIRRRTLGALQQLDQADSQQVVALVSGALEDELQLVATQLRRVLNWVSSVPTDRSTPRILFWVSGGFELNPAQFYAARIDDQEVANEVLALASRQADLRTRVDETARALSALGWTVSPLVIPGSGGNRGIEQSVIESSDDQQGATTAAPAVTLRPGSLFGRSQDDGSGEEAPELRLDTAATTKVLKTFADATGGQVLVAERALVDSVERFAGRVALDYRAPSTGRGETRTREVEVRTKLPTELTIKTRRWRATAVPSAVTRARVEMVLEGAQPSEAAFEIAAVVRPTKSGGGAEGGGRLEARIDQFDPDAELESVQLTVAWTDASGVLRIDSELLSSRVTRELELVREVPSSELELVVLAESTASDSIGGAWGGRIATVADGGTTPSLLPTATVVEIRRPEQEVLKGKVEFGTDVFDSSVARVTFFLDDREVGTAVNQPFRSRIDLGRTPRRRTLRVVAFDAAGNEIGRDTAVINSGSAGLHVQIVSPTNLRQTGLVEFEAEIAVPLERRLDRVLYFWNNAVVATLYGAPFRQRIEIPESESVGYVRVVAMLDDGTLAEDVVFMNGPQAAERLDVSLVELYVVVTDRSGRPVRGLDQTDFVVREDGVPQNVATFSDASDLPLTLGLAIDSSSSMFVKLPRVQQAAIQFLNSTFSSQDRAFVVDFDSHPRLARGTTSDLDRVVDSIRGLQADGQTALWESIVYSLVQLQGVIGRKALVVFSDGADEDDQFPFRSALNAAKRMGAPIYLILMRSKPANKNSLNLFTRSFATKAEKIVEATGGRVFYAKEFSSLDQIYDEIEYELRSQYLLAYYPRAPMSTTWRNIDVDVEKKGLSSRTLSGYWN